MSRNPDSPSALPEDFAAFRGLHDGETCIVSGCGISVRGFEPPAGVATIGVNDIGRLFDPTYLVVLNPRRQFSGDRFRYVEQSRARAAFTQLPLGLPHTRVVRFRLGQRGGVDLSKPDRLPHTRNSPYVALCLALHMGFRRVGLIGVDFTDHHFFGDTGRHPLSGNLARMDHEYRRLAETCRKMGVEVFNLSPVSRLTAFPKVGLDDFLAGRGPVEDPLAKEEEAAIPQPQPMATGGRSIRRVFFVHYRFLACGDVFTQGLGHAAAELGLEHAGGYWDEPGLARRVAEFDPHLLLVVHGRKLARRWRRSGLLSRYPSAVWLLDEPYEVDDTARWSGSFGTVFVNDPRTLDRHRNAHYLPVAWDPSLHHDADDGAERIHGVGFIGGHNPTRERHLVRLAEAGLLSYVVGGPWRSSRLRELCLAANVPPARTAELYRQTRLVLNVFRDKHHYNRHRTGAESLNPRIYEALGCGALVVSQSRDEIPRLFPELPLFDGEDEMLSTVRRLLDDEDERRRRLAACRQELAGHTYSDRLKEVLGVIESQSNEPSVSVPQPVPAATSEKTTAAAPSAPVALPESLSAWELLGDAATVDERGEVRFARPSNRLAGSERGLVSVDSYESVGLTFALWLDADAHFLAKVHQQDRLDQTTNSYHLFCQPARSYVAMHDHIFRDIRIARKQWLRVELRRADDLLALDIDGQPALRVKNPELKGGFCFIGVKGGQAHLRDLTLTALDSAARERLQADAELDQRPSHEILRALAREAVPRVSVVTTVYDRVECLRDCMRSLRGSELEDYEHLIVADRPPPEVLEALAKVVEEEGDERTLLAVLDRRHNDWGIAPARAGLGLARGEYLCFLSDDNGYTPDHLGNLVSVLDRDPKLGFAYSSCDYAGRRVLRSAPKPARIDLGQPLFRRQLFTEHLEDDLPFAAMAWDWEMIAVFLRHGVRWRHVDRTTFLFRLDACRRRRRRRRIA